MSSESLRAAVEDAAEKLAKDILAGHIEDTADALRGAEAIKHLAEALAWVESPNRAR